MQWHPITDLPPDWETLARAELPSLATVWKEQTGRLRQSGEYRAFNERLHREIAIETGILERLYTIDRGTTRLLIEQGINEALIPHGTTNRPVQQVVSLIRDQEAAIEGLFDFVGGQRTLSVSYIKQLHQLLTQSQSSTEALNPLTGESFNVALIKGDWKRHPNNPLRQDGIVHEYSPPEQVASEMDRLVSMHNQHRKQAIPPELESAWLHHRFTQIHPFQDGNGRVARCLASLVCIQSGWFPLVLTRDDRADYITALEIADSGDLSKLVSLFANQQKKAFLRNLSLSEQVLSEKQRPHAIISNVAEKLKQDKSAVISANAKKADDLGLILWDSAVKRLNGVAKEITTEIQGLVDHSLVSAFVSSVQASLPNAVSHRSTVLEVARQLDYFANLRNHHAWVELVIDVGVPTTILLSFHAFGHEYRGLLVCTACAYHHTNDVDAIKRGQPYITDLQPITRSPFTFSYSDEERDLTRRFNQWLEDVIVVGLEYWNQSV